MKYQSLCAYELLLTMIYDYFTLLDGFFLLIISKQGNFPFCSWEVAARNRLRRSHTESANEVGIYLDLWSPVAYLLEQAFIL